MSERPPRSRLRRRRL